ncbi:uncharacterized protein N7469_008220 [Penicillium citrinum]|uniref:Mucin n=1 Tax=Penicillium citrinum TaxID=5077 RepID=A0A9W9TJ35_PENCI|nr:uncharacterized protein N7469_008220 [Penicillium citrinum]KAJ5224717.1 hypothetical protein N7469_008220 [Penicillium citrinum]
MSSSTFNYRSSLTSGSITPASQESYSRKPNFESSTSHWTAPFRDGLPTPPSDMTGLTYNAVPPFNYGSKAHGLVGLPSHAYTNSRPHFDSISSSMMSAMKPHSQPAPAKEAPASESTQKKSTGTTGGSQLRIPSSINNTKGTLAEFAAQMTCLFWFEKTSKIQAIEDRRNPVPSIVPEAIPTAGFQKWVSTILSTTQVSQNVILLALLFVYRLKKFNASVKGKKGSEFRLMTVALMLGNKFLDDNTYTNKTWAEVSGIAVQEIHIMEVEFLSNIRYDLFSSESEWTRWHNKLGLFGDFFNKASQLPLETETPVLQLSPPRLQPQSPSPSSKLPSPPSDVFRPQSQPNWYSSAPGLPYPTPSYLGDVPQSGSHKRSRDEDNELHPTKRVARSNALPTPSLTVPSSMAGMPTLPSMTPTSAPLAQAPMAGPVSRLPPPNLTPTSNPMVQSLPSSAMSQLPALMPPVYNRSQNWAQQIPSANLPAVSSGVYNAPSLPDIGRHNQAPYGVTSGTVSPAVSAYSVHTPQTHLSPSFFLANRNSPYRPVRSVNTLLIPPPTSSLQPQRSVPF